MRKISESQNVNFHSHVSLMNNVINEGKFKHLTQFGNSGNTGTNHCVKSVRIRSFSGPYFPAFRLSISPYSVRMRENTDQKNSEYGLLLRSESQRLRKNRQLEV